MLDTQIELNDIELEKESTQQVQVDPQDFIKLIKHDREALIHFFLSEKIKVPVPWFHKQIADLIIEVKKEQFALAVPRGFAKTTIVKVCIMHYFMFSDISFIVYCSNTTPVAKDECRDIVEFMDTPNFRALFGEPEWQIKNNAAGLYIFTIRDGNGNKKRCILRALGAGQQVRGLNINNLRPQLLVCDDAEDDENSETPAQMRKLRKWVYGPLFKACARVSKKIWIGNLISQHCLINEFCESEFWASIKYGCILKDGTALWPDMFDLEFLKKDFKQYQEAGMAAKWFAEMMNMPIPDGMGLIRSEEIHYAPPRTSADYKYCFITVDPAISNNTWANKTAICVHALVDGKWQIVDHYSEKMDPLNTVYKIIDLCFMWHCRVVGIESIAYQAALISFLKFVLFERRLHGIEIIPLDNGAHKTERIVVFASWLKRGDYCLTTGEFHITHQLLSYDPQKKQNVDDAVDSAAYGPQMITEHIQIIMANPLQTEYHSERAIDVCGI